MSKLDIYIDDHQGKTASRFGNASRIVFHNEYGKSLEVGIEDENVLCKSDKVTPAPNPFDVPALKHKAWHICKDFDGAWFKYTATLETLDPEDPIIIIEHAQGLPVSEEVPEGFSSETGVVLVTVAAGGALVGALAGAFIGAHQAIKAAMARMQNKESPPGTRQM